VGEGFYATGGGSYCEEPDLPDYLVSVNSSQVRQQRRFRADNPAQTPYMVLFAVLG